MVKTRSIQEYHELMFTKDRIRQFSDIRNIPEKDLNSYQKMQLRDIKKYTYDLEMVELRKAIFRTFDFTTDEKVMEVIVRIC